MSWLGGSIAAAAALVTGYWNLVRKVPPSRVEERPGARFPPGFLWGSGEDPYQHEGGLHNNDWARWERQEPSPIDNGDTNERGADFWNRWREDFSRAAADGHNTHRIGFEWSRIEPEPGVYDEAAIATYVDMLRTMKEEHGFVTFANVWHYTLPLWLADKGGWEAEDFDAHWQRYVTLCAERFAPWVDYWSTMIDSQIYALAGHLLGEIPPCVKDERRALAVYRKLIHGHVAAYRILKEKAVRADEPDFVPQVGQIYFFFDYDPRGLLVDRPVKRLFENIFNWAYLDGVIKGEVNLFVPMHRLKEPQDPSLAGTMDFIGVNYFTRQVIAIDPLSPGFVSFKRQTPWLASDMDWEIFPEGLYRLTKSIKRRYGDIPLFITECGLADHDDSRRPRFIVDHLAWVHRAIEEGVNIKGFFHWSMTDNWEWQHGRWPRFGLYAVDEETGERTPRASAALFANIARENALPEELPAPLPRLPTARKPVPRKPAHRP